MEQDVYEYDSEVYARFLKSSVSEYFAFGWHGICCSFCVVTQATATINADEKYSEPVFQTK